MTTPLQVDMYADQPITEGAYHPDWTPTLGLHFDGTDSITLADIPTDELPADTVPDVPDGAVQALYNPSRVWFRGGWTCECVVQSLPLVEAEMLRLGLIKQCIDIYQLGWNAGGVAASAGTHDKGGPIDVGQYGQAALRVWWDFGWWMQRRTVAQGFTGDHGHGGPMGCPHGSQLATWQMQAYRRGLNGLRSNGPADGPWQTMPSWSAAIKAKQAAQVKASAAAKQQAIKAEWLGRLPISYAATMRGITVVERGKPTGNVRIIQDILRGKRFLDASHVTGIWDPETGSAWDAFIKAKGIKRGDQGRPTWQGFASLASDGGWRGVER